MEYLKYDAKEKGIAFGQAVVSWVNKKIKRVFWTNSEIDKWFGKRSVNEIIQNGTTCFMNPCFDLTLVSSYLMTQNKINNNFVVEEHLPTKEFNFNRLHFALNFTEGMEKYYLNYKSGSIVYIGAGEYQGRKDILQAQMTKISGLLINPKKPLHKSLKHSSLEKLFKNMTIGFSLEKNIDRLKQDNNQENYSLYKQKCGENLIINSQQQNQPSI